MLASTMRKKKRKVAPSISRIVAKAARRAGVVPKARRADRQGVCATHGAELLGFSDVWALVRFVDDLARARQGGRTKPLRSVQLPEWKCPDGIRLVIARRCPSCSGVGCHRCELAGWYIVLVPRVPRDHSQRACTHEGAALGVSS